MTVNAWSHFAGTLRIGLEDQDGPIPGHGMDECDPLSGDSMWKTITWKGQSDLSAWTGKAIRLHFELVRGRLYAFRFEGKHKPGYPA